MSLKRSAPAFAGYSVGSRQPLGELAPCFLYLFVDVARPADWFPAIGLARLGLVAALWGVWALIRSDHRPCPRPVWYMLGLCLVMAWHVWFAVNNYRAFWGFVSFTVLVVGYVLPIAALPRTQHATRVLLTTYVLLHIPSAIHALLYKGTGAGGWLGDENDVALAFVVAAGVGYYLWPIQRRAGMRVLLLVAIVLDVAGVVASRSRGGFVGLIALAVFMALTGPKRGRMIVVGLVAAGALLLFAPADYWQEMRTIRTAGEFGDTGETRIYYWKMGWRMFLDHPFAGVGTANYGIHAPDYEDRLRAETTGRHTWGRAAHSLYVTLLAEQGLLGATLFGLILAWFSRSVWQARLARRSSEDVRARDRCAMASAVMAGMVGLLVSGVFLSVLYYPILWVLVGFQASIEATSREAPA